MKSDHIRNALIAVSIIALGALGLSGWLFFRGLPAAQTERMFTGEKFDKAVEVSINNFIQKQQQTDQQTQQQQEQQAQEQAKNVPALRAEDYVFNENRDGEILMIEYSDFECPFCEQFHPIIKQFAEENENVSWVYRQFPLNIHPGAPKKSEAGLCVGKLAGNDGFWQFANAIFEAGTTYPVADLAKLAAESAGVNATEVQKCLDSGEMAALVQTSTQEGSNSGVSGTPATIFLNPANGKVRLVSGRVGADVLTSALNEVK